MFMNMMQYQFTNLIQAFSIWKFLCVKDTPHSNRPITAKIDEIMEKVEQNYRSPLLAVMISEETKHRPQNNF